MLATGLWMNVHRPLHPLSHPKNDSPANENTWDLKLVGFIHNIFNQAGDPTLGIPMLLAGPLGQIGKTFALRGLLAKQGAAWFSRGLNLKFLPFAAEFGVETAAFGLGARSLTHLIKGPIPWDPASVMKDVGLAAFTLAPIKLGTFIGHKGVRWVRGLDELQPKLWTKADHHAISLASHLSAYLGLVASHSLQAKFFPETIHGSGNIWADALGTQLALGLTSHAGRAALGAGFRAFEQKISAEAQRLYELTKTQWNIFGFSIRMPQTAAGPQSALVPRPSLRPRKGENIWNSVVDRKFLSTSRIQKNLVQELGALKQKMEARPSREDYLEVVERLDKLEQQADELKNQEIRQKVADLYNIHFAAEFLGTLPSEELPHFLAGLDALNLNNVQTWGNTFNLLNAVRQSHPLNPTREVAQTVLQQLVGKLDDPGLRALDRTVRKKNSFNSRFSYYLLRETRMIHPDPVIRRNAERRLNNLRSMMDLRRYH